MLTELAESHADTDTGAASALVMANSLARSFTDYRADRDARRPRAEEAQRFLDLAVAGPVGARGRSSWRSPWPARPRRMLPWCANTLDPDRPGQPKPESKAAAATQIAAAERIAEDFAEPQAR